MNRKVKHIVYMSLLVAFLWGNVVRAEPLTDSLESKGIIQATDANGEAQARFDASDLKKVAQRVDENDAAVNSLMEKAEDIDEKLGGVSFGVDENGNVGFKRDGESSITPFGGAPTIVYLGTGASYDLSSYPGYQGFSVEKNVIISTPGAKARLTAKWANGNQYGDWSSDYGYLNSTASYDADSGTLTISYSGSTQVSGKGSQGQAPTCSAYAIVENPQVWLIY